MPRSTHGNGSRLPLLSSNSRRMLPPLVASRNCHGRKEDKLRDVVLSRRPNRAPVAVTCCLPLAIAIPFGTLALAAAPARSDHSYRVARPPSWVRPLQAVVPEDEPTDQLSGGIWHLLSDR